MEANDAVTVAGMTRPKQLPNEQLSDLAVSTATKLQCFRVLCCICRTLFFCVVIPEMLFLCLNSQYQHSCITLPGALDK